MDKMEKKEKEDRIRNHTCYWELVDALKEMSLDALCSDLSVDDVISALDRTKVHLLQQEVIVTIEDAQNETDGDDEPEENDMSIEIPQVGIKTPVPLVDPTGLAEEATRGMYN